MQQLHLVGFTTEHDGLIFSTRKGAKSGNYLIALDPKLYRALDEAEQARDGTGKKRSSARVESALSPRDIQMRLRAGRSVASIASEAGVDEEWVARFAPPIMAEQAQVVGRAHGLVFSKARLGASGRPLAESVWWNIADKGALMAQDSYDLCWSAHHLRDSSWIVRFDFVNRKKRQRAEWELDTREGVLHARNRLASELGYIEPGRRGRPPVPLPPAAKPVAKRAAPAKSVTKTVTSTPRAKPKKAMAKKRVAAPKKRVAAAKKRVAAPKKRAPVRRPAKRAAAKRPAPKRAAAKRPAPKRPAPKRAAAKRPGAKKRAPARRAPAAKRPPAKRPAANKSAASANPPQVTFDTPAFDGEPTRPVTIRAQRAGAAEPVFDDLEDAPVPPPPVLTSTPLPASTAAPEPARRFGRLRRRRPPGP